MPLPPNKLQPAAGDPLLTPLRSALCRSTAVSGEKRRLRRCIRGKETCILWPSRAARSASRRLKETFRTVATSGQPHGYLPKSTPTRPAFAVD